MADDDDDEVVCRYCLDGPDADDEDGEMLKDICACAGGQRYVHRRCLRRWQRMVLVSQPTHPAFYQDDVRHHKCNVCSAEFNIPPPTRHELMASFTGAEIAALISEGCVIGSHPDFDAQLSSQMRRMDPLQRLVCGYRHWIGGAYLITGVVPDDGVETLPVRTDATLDAIRSRLGRDGENPLVLVVGGRALTVVAEGSLEGVAPERMEDALRQLRAPATLVLSSGTTPDCGEDHVSAVNLTRPLRLDDAEDEDPATSPSPLETTTTDDDASRPPTGWAVEARRVVRAAMEAACAKYAGARGVEVSHFRGGPCESDALVSCVVPGGVRRGWTVVTTRGEAGLREAIELAHGRAARRHGDAQGDVSGGQTVRLRGLQARPELNGEIGLALRFEPDSGRWLLRLRNGDGKRVKPANVEPMEGAGGRVLAFWGDARWSRAQLLGEIARGHWGLCRGSVGEVTTPASERHAALEGRLAYAPVTEMTEECMRQQRRDMLAFRDLGVAAEVGAGEGVGRDEAEHREGGGEE